MKSRTGCFQNDMTFRPARSLRLRLQFAADFMSVFFALPRMIYESCDFASRSEHSNSKRTLARTDGASCSGDAARNHAPRSRPISVSTNERPELGLSGNAVVDLRYHFLVGSRMAIAAVLFSGRFLRQTHQRTTWNYGLCEASIPKAGHPLSRRVLHNRAGDLCCFRNRLVPHRTVQFRTDDAAHSVSSRTSGERFWAGSSLVFAGFDHSEHRLSVPFSDGEFRKYGDS